MTEMSAHSGAIVGSGERAPGHLWLVGIGSLLWNAVGALDYTMTHVGGADYLRSMDMGEDVVSWVAALPAWATAGWALGTWGGVIGSVLLLLRSRHAVAAFAVSLLGILTMTAYTLTRGMPASMSTPGSLAFEWSIKLIAVLLLVYAVRMRRRGVLR